MEVERIFFFFWCKVERIFNEDEKLSLPSASFGSKIFRENELNVAYIISRPKRLKNKI